MCGILDDLYGKVLRIARDKHHAFHAALGVTGLDKVVVALDALVDAGEHGRDGVLVQHTEAHGNGPRRIGQLGHQVLHGVLADQLAILAVYGEIAKRNGRHTHDRLVFVLLGLEQMHQGGQTLELAHLLANDAGGAPVAGGQVLQAADGGLDRVAHRRLLDYEQVLGEGGQGPEELGRTTLVRHGHVVRVDREEEILFGVFAASLSARATAAAARTYAFGGSVVRRVRLDVTVVVGVDDLLKTEG